MKRNISLKENYLIGIAILILIILVTMISVSAAKLNSDQEKDGLSLNSEIKCCGIDTKDDAPPKNDQKSSSTSSAVSAIMTSTSGNVKTFRTDTDPELDRYQPCNGGDKLIDFNINVNNIDLSAIKSAKLTLAVWDVDFDCGMPGKCERDTVYVNGHRLTTPEPFLTGANGQWSTVTFNVEPSWIIDGNNYIKIYIDTLNTGYWCVQADWGELQLEIGEVRVVQIDAIDDIAIRDNNGNDINDPVWKKDFDANGNLVDVSPKEDDPIADNRGIFKIKATLKGFPIDPSYTPKVEYTCNIQGISVCKPGNFNGLSGIFEVNNPKKVGKYTLNLIFTIKDDQGNVVSTPQQLSRTLYVTYDAPKTSDKPKVVWLEKATGWANGAGNPTEVVSKMTDSITHIPLWTYKGHHNPDPWITGEQLIEGISNEGSCGPFEEVLQILSAVNGVVVFPKTFQHLYFLTKPLVSLDGNTGNAYENQKTWPNDRDRWVFPNHVVGEYDGKFYDPTFRNNIGYTDDKKNIYCLTTSPLQPDSNGIYYYTCDGGNPTNIYPEMDSSPQSQFWGKWRYKKVLPDFTVNSVSIPTSAKAGDNIIVSWNVKNQGDSSGSFTNRISLATTPYGTDISLGNFIMNSISSGSSSSDSKSVQIPLTVPPGNYYVTVYADTLTEIQESDENNNIGKALNQIQITSSSGIQSPNQIQSLLVSGSQSLTLANINNIGKIGQVENMNLEAIFTGKIDDYGVDMDGNGLFDILIGEVEINVTHDGYYSVLGIISFNQKDITMTTVSEHFNTGNQKVKLYFIGEDIYDAKITGVYNIKAVLYNTTGSQIDYRLFSTSAYEYADFQGMLIELSDFVDFGKDIDNDNLYNYLTAELTLSTKRAGNYSIIGVLHSKEMNTIVSSANSSYLSEGNNKVYLNFNGTEIRKSKFDGPYVIGILLMDEDHHTSKYEKRPTSAYKYTDFQQQSASFQGVYSDYGMDTDGDGLFNYLATKAEVNVLVPGTYTIIGWLGDSGEESDIIWDSRNLYLDAGVQSVQLNFDGMAIYRHGIDGPYKLSFLALYDENGNLIDYQQDVYTTSAYGYTDFQLPPALFKDIYSDYGSDTNTDGLYEYLTVEAGLNLTIAGNYSIYGDLYDKYNNKIADMHILAYLDAGEQTVALNFDGSSIYKHGVNGPFNLTNLLLYDEKSTLMDIRYFAYTTSAYDYKKFQRPPVILTGNYIESPIDTNGNGFYNNFVINVETIVKNAGRYALNARLMDVNENEIGWAATNSLLSGGLPETMQLKFDGMSINKNGINGPYFLRDVYIYNMNDVSKSANAYNAYTTSPYKYFNFEFTNAIGTSTGSGVAYFTSNAGTIQNLISIDEHDLPAEGKPNIQLPHGFFSFNIIGLTPGQSVNVTIALPSDISTNAQYWKYNIPEGWYQIPMGSNDGDNVITIRLQDGGIGDDDGIINGAIAELGGPGILLSDTTPPVIESISLYPVNATPGASINVTVKASDNVGVIEVKADGTSLIYSNGEWNHGSITAPSTIGDYKVTVRANDSVGNFAEKTADYKVMAPKGGIGVGVSPKTTTAPTTGRTIDYTLVIKSTQNFDDIVKVNITMAGLPLGYQMPLEWFDWNYQTVRVASNITISLPLRLEIPPGQTPGRKVFRARGNSTFWSTTASDTGTITIS